jgi:GT2 family glycosyltransferase
MEPNKISVVIVSFRRPAQLRQLLSGLRTPAPDAVLQVIVVDNGSRDGTTSLDDEFPEVRFNHLQRNFGLTRALNIGIRASDGDYVLLLHDDVRIHPAAVAALAEFLQNRSDVAAVCPNLGGPQVRVLPGPASPDPPLQIPGVQNDEITAECVTGAAIMVRAGFLRSMGHIDERYGNYGSDIEICAQVRSSGRKLVILKNVTAQHELSPSAVPASYLEGDRVAGTAAFLGKHYGFAAGLTYRLKSALKALVTFRFRVLAAAKIDGWG